MEDKRRKTRASSLPLFAAGALIFLCGLIIFIFDRTSPTFIYTVVMCGCGIVFIFIAMIRDFALRNRRMGKNNADKSETENTEK